jgi:hypothetical protein
MVLWKGFRIVVREVLGSFGGVFIEVVNVDPGAGLYELHASQSRL